MGAPTLDDASRHALSIGMGTVRPQVHLESSDPDLQIEHVEIHTLKGHESISQPFRFELQVLHRGDDPPSLDTWVHGELDLVFKLGDDEERRIHGMIFEAEDRYDTEDEHTVFHITVVPRIWRMSMVRTQELFLDHSVVDVIKSKLELVGLSEGTDFVFRLSRSYPKREFIVQYKETDLAFMNRLTEHLGISYYFEHEAGLDRIVFVDDVNSFGVTDEDDAGAHFHHRGEETGIFEWHSRRQMIPESFICDDYNYRTPQIELLSATSLGDNGDAGAVVEHGTHFKTTDEGVTMATVRSEEQLSQRLVHRGRSEISRFGAGLVFELQDHPRAEGKMLLVEVEHEAEQSVSIGLGSGTERTYRNRFRCIAGDINYRPPRITPRPRIHGVITGIIESDATREVGKFARIDDQGRYWVKFLFDYAPPGERKASHPVRRLQPTAGPNYGMHFPLRPGIEVLIAFVDGDPDRPLIVGAVPNPLTQTPVDASVATKNRLKTESGVLFEIEDGAGS
jgi:type VI secretion system secreted protein VgrG